MNLYFLKARLFLKMCRLNLIFHLDNKKQWMHISGIFIYEYLFTEDVCVRVCVR